VKFHTTARIKTNKEEERPQWDDQDRQGSCEVEKGVWQPGGYRDYDRNWLSENVIAAVSQHQVFRGPADIEIGERGKFLILLEGGAASHSDGDGLTVGMGRAISQSAVESFSTS